MLQLIGVDECMRRIHTMAEEVKEKANIDKKTPFKTLVRYITHEITLLHARR